MGDDEITGLNTLERTGGSSSRLIDPAFNFASLQWALAIDGKDADKGKSAYGKYFERGVVDAALPLVLQWSSGAGCEKVSMDLIHHIRQSCCTQPCHGCHWRAKGKCP